LRPVQLGPKEWCLEKEGEWALHLSREKRGREEAAPLLHAGAALRSAGARQQGCGGEMKAGQGVGDDNYRAGTGGG
jgi:hypothetical protein